MTKLSVKKPLTVFVAVVIILVLGVISYTKMTPDLLPNIDMPYVLVTTTYPGASPEKVESEVTKPLERALGTLESIKNVNSTSNENYSMLILEFEDTVDMDALTVDILQKINQVEGDFDEKVSTPTILKINPNMMPVLVAAVEVEGMDTIKLSNFVNDELLSKLEGTEGVVSVTPNGLITKTVEIKLDDEKIKKLNSVITGDLTEEFDKKEAELNNSEEKIKNGKKEVEAGKKQLEEAKKDFLKQTKYASKELNDKNNEIEAGKIQIKEQIQELEEQKLQLEANKLSLEELKNTLDEIDANEKTIKNSIELLSGAIEGYGKAKTVFDGFNTQIEAINNSSLSNEEKEQALKAIYGNEQYKQALIDVETYSAVFKAYNVTPETASATLTELNASLKQLEIEKNIIDTALKKQGIERDDLEPTINEINAGMKKIDQATSKLNQALKKLEKGEIKLDEAMLELETQKSSAMLEFSSSTSTLLVTSANLDATQLQLEQGKETFKEAKETALKGADLTKLITKEMVSNILTAQNFSMPAGYAISQGNEYTVTVGEEYSNLDDIKNQILFDLGLDGVEPIRISDVSNVDFADNSNSIYTKVNNENGILLTFQKQSTYATAEVSNNIAETFEKLEKQYDNLKFVTFMDQGDYIYMITDTLFESLLYGAILAILVLFIFLKDIKPTIVTLFSIPVSLIFTIILMYFSGISINMMSLSGLAIAVGMLVDNSVVVIENVYRLKSLGVSSVKAAVSGAKQVAGAITASTLTTICVFLPIVFIEGLSRQLFTDMALTITYSLLASLIIALTLVPSMSSRLLRNSQPKQNKTLDKIINVYRKLLSKSLRHKAIVLVMAVLLLITSATLVFAKGFIFMPESETNQISVTLTMPNNTKFEDTKKEADSVLNKILSINSVDEVGVISSDSKTVSYYILLDENAQESGIEVAEKINHLCKDQKGAVSATSSMLSSSMSALTGDGISIKIYGEDLEQLSNTAKKMEKLVKNVKKIETVDNGIGETNPSIKINVDKNKAMKEGITVAQVFQNINTELQSEVNSTTVTLDNTSYSVNVVNDDGKYKDVNYLENYVIEFTDTKGNEKSVKLSDIADIENSETLASISRENQKRYINLTATVKKGENVTVATENVKQALIDFDTPDGITFEFDGENEMIMNSIYDLLIMLLIGILLVYLVMVAQFQSLKSPFIVMFTIPLAFTGGLIALLLCNMEISVVSMMGFILLCGVIVNNGIVLVDYINQLRIEGKERREAIIEAGITRFRPVLMTTITTVFGLIVMALGLGDGAEIMQPIAVVCIGGLVYATLLTLFIVPIIYDIMNKKEIKTVDEKELEYIEK